MQQRDTVHEKPSVFLRNIRQLAGTEFPEDYLYMYFLERLPRHIRSALLANGSRDLSALAQLADRIWEADKLQMNAIKLDSSNVEIQSEAHPSASDWQEMVKEMESLKHEIKNLHCKQDKQNFSKARQAYDKIDTRYNRICFYHRKFGNRARKCEAPCKFEINFHQGNEQLCRQ